MSTRLENGVRIKGQYIWDFSKDLRPVMERVWDEKARGLAGHQILRAWVQEQSGTPVLSAAEKLWRHVPKEIKDDYLKFEFVFFESPRGYLLGYPFGSMDFINALFAMPQVESWGYQSITDPDEDVSAEEWEERKEEWEALLKMDGSNSLASFPSWSVPRYDDIFLPILLKPFEEEELASTVGTPVDFARQRIMHEFGAHLLENKDHQSWLRLNTYVDKLPVESLGTLPRPLTVDDLVSTERCEYESPEALKEDLQARFAN